MSTLSPRCRVTFCPGVKPPMLIVLVPFALYAACVDSVPVNAPVVRDGTF